MSRHDISEDVWNRVKPFLCPPRKETRGRPPADARRMLYGILWILRTGAPWRDLPDEFGPWQTVYKRFNSWSKSAIWHDVLHELSREADLEAIIFDGSYVRAHQHSAGAKKGAEIKPSAAVVAG